MFVEILQSIYTTKMWAKNVAFKWWIVAGIFSFILGLPSSGLTQENPDYYEISVFLNVSRIGGFEVPAIIFGDEISLSVTDVFGCLKIKNTPTRNFDSISGFFINQNKPYLIDRVNNRVDYDDKVFNLGPGDLMQTETGLYLKSNYFGSIFGLECTFNFRSLSVNLDTKLELPIIREMRQEMMRENIKLLKGEVEADTTIGPSYPFFSMGMFDWSIYSTQFAKGPSITRLNLSIGSVLAGGETNVSLNYTTGMPFLERQQYYMWRFVRNDFRVMKQAMLGKINPNATSSMYHPVVGAQITNTPTTYRRSFGTFTLSDYTKAGWMVELYVNNVLIDYQQADASGFYSFDVPLVYGNSEVKLRFFGPWGEETSSEQNINIPYNFLPKNQLEYTLTAGIVEDTANSRFSRGEVGYGLGRNMTLGAGVEYLSSVTSGSTMPFVKTSFSLFNNLLLSADYTHGVQLKSLLNYRMFSGLQFELSYTKYKKGQQAISNNYLEERKAVVTLPIRKPNFSMFTRFSVNQFLLTNSKYTNTELLLSGNFFGINTNLTTFAIFSSQPVPYVYSSLSLTFRLPANIIVTPQANYEYNENRFISLRCEVEKRFFHNSYLVVSYEENLKSDVRYFQLGARVDLSVAQTSFFVRHGNSHTSYIQSARGSLVLDTQTGYVAANNRTSLGKGGLIVSPFLDVNCNGKQDKGEPKVFGLNVRVTGGNAKENEADSTIIITELEPYTNYLLELDINSFDNIAWQVDKLTYSIAINANQLRYIEIPVAVVGEAAGMVYLEGDRGIRGQGRITVNFYDSNKKIVASTLTEQDGYFSYLGLAPGKYTAKIDPGQLKNLGMGSSPPSSPFTIRQDIDGDYVDDLEFIIKK